MTIRPLLPFFAVATALASLAVRPAPAASQSLHLAELFAEQGRVDDARAEVLAWFEIRGDDATSNEVQHGLWLRGRLAQDPEAGVADLDRLVEDHPEGPYTGLALAWLAATAAEWGDEPRAAALYTRVVQSHPESEGAGRAREWLRQRGITVDVPVREHPTPTRPAAPAVEVPVDDSLPPASVDSLRSAPKTDSAALGATADPVVAPPMAAVDTAVASPMMPADTVEASPIIPVDSVTPPPAAAVDSAPSPPAAADTVPEREVTPIETVPPPADPDPEPAPERIPPGPPVPGAATAGSFAVQIGAFRNPVGAGGLVDELITAGFDARLVQVPINDLLRVRIGRFATLEEAQAELQRVRAGGYDGAVVNDARRETQVR